MPTVQPVNSTLPSDPESVTGLSSDALISYCDTRLSSLDSQMQAIFDQQTQSAATIQDVDAIASELNALPQPTSSSSSNVTLTPAQVSAVTGAYYKAIDDLSPIQGTPAQMYAAGSKTPLGAELQTDLAAFNKAYRGGDYQVPEATITNLSQNLKTYSSNLSSDSEMQMVNLQSLMSSRETAVELSTNLMQSMASTDQDIAANLKDG